MIRLGLEEYRPARKLEQRVITLSDFPQLAQFLGPSSTTGVVVNEATALNFSAYFDGVDVISGQVAKLPLKVYRKIKDDEREEAHSHPAYRLLHDEPNPYMIPFVFWQTLMGHLLTWGNAYAEIEFDRALRPVGLWPIAPDKMEVRAETVALPGGGKTTRVYYVYIPTQKRIEAEDLLHIPGLGFDGLKGYSVVAMARRSLSLSATAEQFGTGFYANGAIPGIVLEHPKELTTGAAARLRESWDARHMGKPGRTAVLEEGMKANVLGIPLDDAQFLGSMEHGILEIARWLNISPHKLKYKIGERPGGNLEAAQIDFLTDTLDPWLVRICQETRRKLIAPQMRSSTYPEHETGALLRVTAEARANSYKAYYDMGVMDAETIARKENLPKPKPKAPPPEPPPAPPAPPDQRMEGAQRALVIDSVIRFWRRESEQVKRAAAKGPEGFEAWLEEFYRKEALVLRAFLVPAVRVNLAHRGISGDPDEVADGLARAYVERSKEELLGLPAKDLAEHVSRLTSGWETGRPLEVAERMLTMNPEEVRRKTPSPTVNVTVQVPEGPPAQVHVTVPVPSVRVDAPVTVNPEGVTVNVPPQKTPEVNVTVPVPSVKVENRVEVPAPRPLKIERDADGNMIGVKPT